MQTAHKLFKELALDGEIDQTHWTRFCRFNNVSSGVFTVAFARATRGAAKKMNEAIFVAAIDALAAKDVTIEALLVPQVGPAATNTRAPLKGPVRFFYDKRTYTGTHKSDLSEVSVVHDLRQLCDRSLCDARGRKISATPAPGFATHDDIKNRKFASNFSAPATPRPSTVSTPKATTPTAAMAAAASVVAVSRRPSIARKASAVEEEHTQPPPVPTKFEEVNEKENVNKVKPTEAEIDLFSNIPTFAFTPVWPTKN
jgi:hypothetical protein